MKIFISWSGERSNAVASALRDWLRNIIQAADPWMSDKDIESGGRWADAISGKLRDAKVGVACVTPENKERPWINFEAGAISKTVDDAYLCPFLHGLEPSDLSGPLSQFQARKADRDGTYRLLQTINGNVELSKPLSEQQLSETFDVWWPKLAEKLNNIPVPPTATPKPREVREIAADTLDIVKQLVLQRADGSSTAPVPQVQIKIKEMTILRVLLENGVTILPIMVSPHIINAVKTKATNALLTSFPDDDVFALSVSYLHHGQVGEARKTLSVLTGCSPLSAKGAIDYLAIVMHRAGVEVPPSE